MSVLDLGADTVYVVPPTTPTVVAAPPTPSSVPVVVVSGPQGIPGGAILPSVIDGGSPNDSSGA